MPEQVVFKKAYTRTAVVPTAWESDQLTVTYELVPATEGVRSEPAGMGGGDRVREIQELTAECTPL